MPEPRTAAYERTDADPFGIALVGGALVIGGVITFIVIWLLLGGLDRARPSIGSTSRHLAPTETAPDPKLQTDEAADLARLRAAENAALTTYGWIDRAHGVIRIPIDRSIDLTLQRGLPIRSPQSSRSDSNRANSSSTPAPVEND
jgi:hypothetical protein